MKKSVYIPYKGNYVVALSSSLVYIFVALSKKGDCYEMV